MYNVDIPQGEQMSNLQVQKLTLDDGRVAERHVSTDEAGNEIIEIFAEEKRPLKLEKRVKREYKTVVAKETHEMVRDGEVTHVEVHSGEPEVPLKLQERIATVDHAQVVNGDYVRKDEIGRIVADSVVAGVSTLMANMEVAATYRWLLQSCEPLLLENNVADKQKTDNTLNIVLFVILAAQIAFVAWWVLA
jgi:hypothetical protein